MEKELVPCAKRNGLWMREQLIIALCLLFGAIAMGWFSPSVASAAITQPGAWTAAINVAANSGTYSYTAATGSNRVVVVTIESTHAANSTYTPTVTFGGTALTLARGDNTTSMRNHTSIYYLPEASIPSGAQTLSVSLGVTTQRLYVGVATFAGVDQTTPIDASQNASRNTDGVTAVFGTALTINANTQAVLVTNLYNHTDTASISGYATPSGWSAAALTNNGTTTNAWYFFVSKYATIPSTNTSSTASWGSNLSPGTIGFSMTGVSLRMSTTTGNLTVGNGATIANANAQQGSMTNIMDSFTLVMSSASGTVNTLALTGSTNFTATNVANITVYSDNSSPQGSIGGTDAVIPSTYTLSGNVATITFTTPESISTATKNYLVVVDVKSTATVGNTLSGTITAATGTSLGTPTYSDSASGVLTVTAGTCLRSTPSVSLGSNGNVSPGGQNAYTLSITNNDTAFCSTSTFTLSVASETGNTVSFILPSSLGSTTTGAMSPSGTYNTTFTVNAQAGATIGDTLTSTVNAADAANHVSQTGSGSVTTTVINTPSTSYLMHNSANISPSKYGTWGTAWNCATCHKTTTTNVKQILTTINTPTGPRSVVFTRMTTSSHSQNGVFGDDQRTYAVNASTNICEVCHHKTSYHQYSSSKVAGNTHNIHDGKDCTNCHRHGNAFAGQGHAFPYQGTVHRADAGTSPYSSCTGCHTNAAGGTYPVAAGTAPNCTGCHVNTTNWSGASPGCWDCHGSSATNGLPNTANLTSFPNRQGQHNQGNHSGQACTACHAWVNGSTKHGYSNRKKSYSAYSSVKQKLSVYTLNAARQGSGTRVSGDATCSGNVGCCTSHGSTSWY